MGRYDKQIRLKNFGAEGQERLRQARILIVGLGGLGIPAAQYLNAMGIGILGLMDGDTVALSNLHRQVLYDQKDVGRLKVEVAAEKLQAQNPESTICAHPNHLTPENALEICKTYDLIIDASDNFGTRYLVNDVAVLLDIPFVYAALHGWEGQIAVFNYRNGPTYRCVFPHPPAAGSIPNCDTYGVLGIFPGILGSMQGLEAVKTILELDEVISGKLLLYNSLQSSMEAIQLPERQAGSEVKSLAADYQIVCPSQAFVTSDAMSEILEGKDPVQLIDVRTDAEFQADHIPGSVNVPLDTMVQAIANLDWDIPSFLICQSGTRSQLAQQKIIDMNGKEIPFVQGGLNELSALCS